MWLPQMVTSNRAHVHKIYAQIDGLADSLVHAVPDVTVLSPAAQEAVQVLAKYVLSYPSLEPETNVHLGMYLPCARIWKTRAVIIGLLASSTLNGIQVTSKVCASV